MFKDTARDQGHYKGPSGAFVTYCNISCFIPKQFQKPAIAAIPSVFDIGQCMVIHCDAGGVSLVDQRKAEKN